MVNSVFEKGYKGMKFSEYRYDHVNMEEVESQFKIHVDAFANAKSFEEQDLILVEINNQRIHLASLWSIVSIRHTIDTTDAFFKEENNYFDEIGPKIQGLNMQFYQVLTESVYREQLEEKWGKQLFRLAEINLKTFSPEVVPDLQEENSLTSEYTKLLASAQIHFDGQVLNLSQIGPYQTSKERSVRKAASEALWRWFEDHETELY